MILHAILWNTNGQKIASFENPQEINKQTCTGIINDITKLGGSGVAFREILVIYIDEKNKDRVVNKLKSIFYKITIN